VTKLPHTAPPPVVEVVDVVTVTVVVGSPDVEVVVGPGVVVLEVVEAGGVVLVEVEDEDVVVGAVVEVVEVVVVVGDGAVVEVVGAAGHWHSALHVPSLGQPPRLPGGSHCSPAETLRSPHATSQSVPPALQHRPQSFFSCLHALAFDLLALFAARVHALRSLGVPVHAAFRRWKSARIASLQAVCCALHERLQVFRSTCAAPSGTATAVIQSVARAPHARAIRSGRAVPLDMEWDGGRPNDPAPAGGNMVRLH
jgi:hypothetical protein